MYVVWCYRWPHTTGRIRRGAPDHMEVHEESRIQTDAELFFGQVVFGGLGYQGAAAPQGLFKGTKRFLENPCKSPCRNCGLGVCLIPGGLPPPTTLGQRTSHVQETRVFMASPPSAARPKNRSCLENVWSVKNHLAKNPL